MVQLVGHFMLFLLTWLEAAMPLQRMAEVAEPPVLVTEPLMWCLALRLRADSSRWGMQAEEGCPVPAGVPLPLGQAPWPHALSFHLLLVWINIPKSQVSGKVQSILIAGV